MNDTEETQEQERERIAAFEAWLGGVRGRSLGPLEGFNGAWAAARARGDAAVKEMEARELHHFEVEEENARLRAVITAALQEIGGELEGSPS